MQIILSATRVRLWAWAWLTVGRRLDVCFSLLVGVVRLSRFCEDDRMKREEGETEREDRLNMGRNTLANGGPLEGRLLLYSIRRNKNLIKCKNIRPTKTTEVYNTRSLSQKQDQVCWKTLYINNIQRFKNRHHGFSPLPESCLSSSLSIVIVSHDQVKTSCHCSFQDPTTNLKSINLFRIRSRAACCNSTLDKGWCTAIRLFGQCLYRLFILENIAMLERDQTPAGVWIGWECLATLRLTIDFY